MRHNCDKELPTYPKGQKREQGNGMGTEPPAQRSRLGLRGRLHGLNCQALVRFDIADDGEDQFVSRRCREVVSGLVRHQKSIRYATYSMQHGSFAIKLP